MPPIEIQHELLANLIQLSSRSAFSHTRVLRRARERSGELYARSQNAHPLSRRTESRIGEEGKFIGLLPRGASP